tara:strand:- start:193 stop:321 length:129 start_codon:yes stop_codon:yes gene_type:complete
MGAAMSIEECKCGMPNCTGEICLCGDQCDCMVDKDVDYGDED